MPSEAASSDPASLALAELIAMRPRVVRGTLPPGARIPGGARVGTRRAQGSDFDGIGPYQPGDDIRKIAWGASARSGKIQTKQFVADAHRARMVVLDDRSIFSFGTRAHPMAKTAALAAAFLIWEAVILQEAVGLSLVGEERISAPRRGSGYAMTLLERLALSYQRQIAGETDNDPGPLAERLNTAASVLRRGDEICAVSDFAGIGERFKTTSRALEPLRDLRAFVVEDPVIRQGLKSGRYPVEG
ncbi:MAG: DUF58 domain-containing protein, partial [Pseudomonadota bacterium]